jgi:hypothetical protein
LGAKAGSKGIVRSSGQLWPSQPVTSESLITVESAMRKSAMAGDHGDATRSGPALSPAFLAVPELIRSADIKLNQQA